MNWKAQRLGACLLIGLAGALCLMGSSNAARKTEALQSTSQDSNTEPIPAFHTQPPEGALPPTMDPAEFKDVMVQNAYAVASKVKRLLYQQPCYCHCDRAQGHHSLLDCYTGKHASGCEICMREAFYTYEQAQKGKTAAQIRQGIENDEWVRVDTSKYQKPLNLK